MEEFIVWALMSIGISNALTREYVFGWWRRWVEKTFPYNEPFIYLVNCPVCTSFWVGTAASFLFPSIQWWWAGFAATILAKIVVTYTEKI